MLVAVIWLLARESDTPPDGNDTGPSGSTGSTALLTRLSPTTTHTWTKDAGCYFAVEDGVLTATQEVAQPDFCKAGTVNPDFQEVLDPSIDAKIADMWVAADVTVVEGMGMVGLRCRGVGSTAAWSGYIASIDSQDRWMLQRYEGGTPVFQDGPTPLPAGASAGPEHRLDLACVGTGSSFELEFAVDRISVVSSSDLVAPAASGQVGIAIDTDGSPETTVEFRDLRIFVPLEDLIRS